MKAEAQSTDAFADRVLEVCCGPSPMRLAGGGPFDLFFPRLTPQERGETVQHWARKMLAIFGIGRGGARHACAARPDAAGDQPPVVARHPAIHAAQHVRFVAKSNIRHWP